MTVSIPPAGRDYLTQLREELGWSQDRVATLEGFIDFMRDYHPREVESCEAAYKKVCDQTKGKEK